MKKLLVIFPVVLFLYSCFDEQIDYVLNENNNEKSIILENNDYFKISYDSPNVVKDHGFYPSQLVIFNKSKNNITVNKLLFIHKLDNGDIIKNEENNITISSESNINSFLPQYGIGNNLFKTKDINEMFDLCKNINSIKLTIFIELKFNNEIFKIDKEYILKRKDSFYL